MDTGARRGRRDAADEVRDLQVRALELLATRWSGVPGAVAGGSAATDARALDSLVGGLTALRHALPAGGVELGAGTVAGPAPDDAAERARDLLAAAGEALGVVAEAARRAATALSIVGAEPAAEHADGIMTAASALRMLVELERDAIAAS